MKKILIVTWLILLSFITVKSQNVELKRTLLDSVLNRMNKSFYFDDSSYNLIYKSIRIIDKHNYIYDSLHFGMGFYKGIRYILYNKYPLDLNTGVHRDIIILKYKRSKYKIHIEMLTFNYKADMYNAIHRPFVYIFDVYTKNKSILSIESKLIDIDIWDGFL